MGFFGTKVKHQPIHGREAVDAAYGGRTDTSTYWNIWLPKFPIKGERNDCFAARLELVDGKAHLVMDEIDYGAVSEDSEGMDALAEYGGESCPAVLRITKPNAANFHVSVRKIGSRQT